MDLLEKYLESNKKNLLIYIGVCLLFYVVNYLFFRNNIDAPADLIFTVLYISVAPAVIVLFTFLKGEISFSNNRFVYVCITLLIPFLISVVFAMIYWVIEMQDSARIIEIIGIQLVSLPLMVVVVIVVLLFQIYNTSIYKVLLIGITVFIVYYFIQLGLSKLEMTIEDSIYTTIGLVILYIVIPFGFIIYLVRRIDTSL